MVKSVFFKPVSLCLAVVTFIESLIWAVLSFLCVLCYNDIIKYDPNDDSMSFGLKAFTSSLYDLYLSGKPSIPNDHRAVIPSTFHILMWIYFILSLLLCFISGVHISVLCTNSKPRKTNLSTIVWQSLTYTVCLFDIITCILFGIDYQFIKDYIKIDTPSTELYLAVSITLCVLAAKGFILWFFNFIVSVIVSVIFRKKVEEEPILQVVNPKMYARTNAAYDAYGDVQLDPQMDSNSIETRVVDDQPNNNWLANNANTEEAPPEQNHDSMSSSLSSFNYDYDYNKKNNYVVPMSNTYPHVPRARTDSYQTPRSLVSNNPSPIPEPSLPSTHVYEEPENRQRRQSVYEREDDDDDIDILNSPTYLHSAIPNTNRFNLQEPTPDY